MSENDKMSGNNKHGMDSNESENDKRSNIGNSNTENNEVGGNNIQDQPGKMSLITTSTTVRTAVTKMIIP